MHEARSVLLVDDEDDVLLEYAEALRPRIVFGAKDSAEACRLATARRPDAALVDLWLGDLVPSLPNRRRKAPPQWGIEVIRSIRATSPGMMIALITGGYSRAYACAARDAGANGSLPKNLGPNKIIDIIEGGSSR